MDENATRLWLNGYILIGTSTRIPVQEVSVDLSRDLKEYYSAGSPDASALIPGQNKIEFSIKTRSSTPFKRTVFFSFVFITFSTVKITSLDCDFLYTKAPLLIEFMLSPLN